jgi:hypothetical protein
LWALPQAHRLFGKKNSLGEVSMLREQAWKTIENVVGTWRTPEKERYRRDYDAKADWEKHKRIARAFGIHWDAVRQDYVGRQVP